MEKGTEKLIGILSKAFFSIGEGKLPRQTSNCLREEQLEEYYQGILSKPEREKLDQHLVDCQFCYDRLLILDEVAAGEQVEIPQKLVAKTKQLVSGNSGRILEIVLMATQKAIRIIKNTGDLIAPAPILQPARGQENKINQDQVYDSVTISKEFEELKLDIQIECVNDSYKVILNASDPINHTPLTGTRLALFSDDRELSSVEESEAIFYLKLRKYLIKVLFADRDLGEIRLDLRRAS